MAKKPHPLSIMIKTIKGDLVKIADETSLFDVYIHGANCQSVMGAGVAAQIARKFPMVYKVDKESKLPPRQKLGKYTSCNFKNSIKHRIHFVNAYTQFTVGMGVQVNYMAIKDSFEAIRTTFGGCKLRFAMPMIGAGLGGGDWTKIKGIADEVFEHEDVTVIEYEQKL